MEGNKKLEIREEAQVLRLKNNLFIKNKNGRGFFIIFIIFLIIFIGIYFYWNFNKEKINGFDDRDEINLKTTLLAKITDLENINTFVNFRVRFLNGGRAVYYFYDASALPEKQNSVILNGDSNNVIQNHDIISGGLWSPFIYTKQKDEKYVLIKDGKEENYELSPIKNIAVSENGKTVAYSSARSFGTESNYVVVNGDVGKEYDAILDIAVSPSGKNVAYIALDKDIKDQSENVFVVLNENKIGGNYLNITKLVFSPNSNRVAYIATRFSNNIPENFECYAVVDGKEISQFDCNKDSLKFSNFFEYAKFSPDSSHVVYKFDSLIIIDGKIEKKHSTVSWPVFSPDSNYITYVAYEYGRGFIIILDNKEIDRIDSSYFDFDKMPNIIWNPTSKNFVYKKTSSSGSSLIIHELDKKEKIGKKHDEILNILFSSNGQKLIYLAMDFVYNEEGIGIGQLSLVDGYTGEKIYEGFNNLNLNPIFSDDGISIAYVDYSLPTFDGDYKYHMVINGDVGKDYDKILTDPTFSKDGNYVGYGVLKGNELWWIVDKVNN